MTQQQRLKQVATAMCPQPCPPMLDTPVHRYDRMLESSKDTAYKTREASDWKLLLFLRQRGLRVMLGTARIWHPPPYLDSSIGGSTAVAGGVRNCTHTVLYAFTPVSTCAAANLGPWRWRGWRPCRHRRSLLRILVLYAQYSKQTHVLQATLYLFAPIYEQEAHRS